MAMNLPHVAIARPFTSPEAFLSGVDLVAIPSRWEAFGLVGTEARAAGRPLIAADVDGLRDQAGEHSFVHPVGDVCALRHAILTAARAGDLTDRAHAARAEAQGEYDTMIESWARLLARSDLAGSCAA